MCKIPCSECDKFHSCKTFLKDNRCRNCKNDFALNDLLTGPCTKCCGFSLINKSCKDLFEPK